MTKSRSPFLYLALLLLVLLATAPSRAATPMTQADREEYLRKLEQILPPLPSWNAWQQKTGALPPDFNSLPKHKRPSRSADVSGWAASTHGSRLGGAAQGDLPPSRRSMCGAKSRPSPKSTQVVVAR